MAKFGEKRKSKEGGSAVEEGQYTAKITKCEKKFTKDSKKYFGYVVSFKLDSGKTMTNFYNWKNANSQAEEIGREQLDALSFGCGMDGYADTDDFVGRKVLIDVVVDGKYNKITRYTQVSGKKKSKKKGKKGKKNW